jgi:glutathione synthase/RimK-type ligase-like ATP-grasp enzyme
MSRGFQALVACSLDSHSSGRVPAVLTAAGLRVTLVGPERLAVRHSRHVDRYVRASSQDPHAVVAAALDLLRSADFDYCCWADDAVLVAAAERFRADQKAMSFPVTPSRCDLVVSKLAMLDAVVSAGIPTPKFYKVETWEGARQAYEKLGPDVVLKRSAVWPGGLARVQSEAELRTSFSEIAAGYPALLQEFVASKVLCTAAIFHQGVPVCWLSYELSDPWPTPYASASTARIVDHPDLRGHLINIGSLTQFNGLAGLDWLTDERSERLLFLELNARPIPGIYLDRRAGVSFASAIRDVVKGQSPRIQTPSPPSRGCEKVHLFPQTLYRAVRDRNLRDGLRSLGNAPWSDPGLVAAHVRRWITHHIPDKYKRSLRRLGRSGNDPRPA